MDFRETELSFYQMHFLAVCLLNVSLVKKCSYYFLLFGNLTNNIVVMW